MIIHRNKKLLIVLNPKTGSKSIHRLFEGSDIADGLQFSPRKTHVNLGVRDIVTRVPELLPELMAGGWRVFVFYRDPIDRFFSGMGHQYKLNPQLMRDGMTVTEYLDEVGGFPHQRIFLTAQGLPTSEFDVPGLQFEYLDFEDYTNEVIKLAAEFGLRIGEGDVPKDNVTQRKIPQSFATPEEIARIKEIYQMDYDFLNGMGLQVKSA